MHERFVYYHVARTDAAAVERAISAMQRALCRRHRQLRARLLRRPDDADRVTFMETYATEAAGRGVDDALLAEIETAAAAAAAGRLGPRHIETFEPCAS